MKLTSEILLVAMVVNTSNVSPHCLMKLLTSDWNMLKYNVIHLTRSNVYGWKSHYNDFVWGENIIPQKRRLMLNDSPMWVKEINLSQTKS